MTVPRPILAVVGPTASGKSELGIVLAETFDGEIINCDSVQLYRGLYIGTAKVPPEKRRGITHHLIDVLEPTEHFTAGEYARRALSVIAEIEARGKLAILVGGTGFYIRALRQPLFPSPPTDLALRERLKRILERRGPEHLHRMLERVDREAAARIRPRDWSRTTRALEYFFQTGRRISDAQRERPAPPPLAHRLYLIALDPPREELYRRINRRAEEMFARGWIEEVQALLRSGVPETAKALQAHGYRRIVQYLRGEISLERAIELTQRDVRHYAKRQLTWFRREPNLTWFCGFGDDPNIQRAVIQMICARWGLPVREEALAKEGSSRAGN
ncbi:MAG: tRNA (adenosine(37)-N6)-dimethylallyltransferase MiaA [Blastocatellia bacterium]|nr:tRNA (adenosine(37)-N6)-dimethylallyltransferase MiaA [Blastocatellia bacterium]MCS7158294.1 tRNA (adenosine(37)-N6)-dimethylallyltransferase MiaA [Blastocatellia bacterium]MDW8255721.1 tRNA (adenosine(37)-N6)-dimethylallyltransferase MiaA [Acidobacteriota bacterium]